MFGWFKKPRYSDQVWMTDAARISAIGQWIAQHPDGLVLAFFPASAAPFPTAHLVDAMRPPIPRDVCVVEHHPLPARNEKLLKQLGDVHPVFHNSLEEPIMRLFGGERVVTLMKQLGMQPDENVSHPMVTRAMENARKKIAKKVPWDQSAQSMQEWFARNGL